MHNETLTISETPWLAIIGSLLIPVGLVGWAMDAAWVHVGISSPVLRSIIFTVFIVLEIYLLLRGVWPRTITVNPATRQITIAAYCPCLFPPAHINFSDIQKIRVGDYTSSHSSGRMFNLVLEKRDGTTITFGDWNDRDQGKYERWRDEITAFADIDNVTPLSG